MQIKINHKIIYNKLVKEVNYNYWMKTMTDTVSE